jgi:predicted nucleic acid-binding protein
VKVLLDTNVVLDVLLDRKPHVADSARIFCLVEEGKVSGMLCATTLTTLDYLLTQSLGRSDSRPVLARLMRLFDIAPVTRAVIEGALRSAMTDFEDAVLVHAARQAGADAVITRNPKDFAKATCPIFDPRQFLAQFQ